MEESRRFIFQNQQSILVGVIAAVVSLITMAIAENADADKWQVVSQLPTQRYDFSTVVVDNKVYLIGGNLFENQNGPFGLSTVEVYDPQTNTWERLAEMSTHRASPGTAVVDGKIYVFGGYNGIDNRGENFKVLDVVEMYDPQTDIWVRKQDMPIPRYIFGVGVVADKIYAIGGTNFLDLNNPWRFNLVEVYDPITDIWAKRANMPTRRDFLSVEVVGEVIYALGGRGWPQVGNQGGPFLTNIEEYHPKVNRWKKKADMPNARSSFSTVVVENRIYIIAGINRHVRDVEPLATVDIYNPDTEEWSNIPPMSTGKWGFGAAVVSGKIYVFGGKGKKGKESVRYTTVEVFDTGFRAVTAKNKFTTRWGALKMKHDSGP